jgi:wobble nucleotide-excising tRNase
MACQGDLDVATPALKLIEELRYLREAAEAQVVSLTKTTVPIERFLQVTANIDELSAIIAAHETALHDERDRVREARQDTYRLELLLTELQSAHETLTRQLAAETKRADDNAAIYAALDQRMRYSGMTLLQVVDYVQGLHSRAETAEAQLASLTREHETLKAQLAEVQK